METDLSRGVHAAVDGETVLIAMPLHTARLLMSIFACVGGPPGPRAGVRYLRDDTDELMNALHGASVCAYNVPAVVNLKEKHINGIYLRPKMDAM